MERATHISATRRSREADHFSARPPILHACQGGAAVGVLEHEFPKDVESLEAMLAQMLLSLEWAGLHNWFDVETGAAMGRQVAALSNAF
jgi:hypothetical protein